ncbi:ShlB/FhaC/HecB family hemolysin secretion/activation protein [Paracandidimonas soli]|uniref:ShlB/FhaC/HecB family hemolysin secretion/activation protein n=1 Tax=Paracandidimonas soli TaxID=1917182 RepID=UPI00333E919C
MPQLHRVASLSCLALVCHAAHANGPLLGNPVDQIPQLQHAQPQQPPARLQMPDRQQAAVIGKLQQRITPRHFDVRGSTAIPFEQITDILTPLSGQEMTVGQLIQHVNRITALYQQAGYPLSFALLQEQKFDGGRVHVTVVEGHIGSLRIEGDAGGAERRLHALAGPLLEEKPLTRATLERVLNLMRSVPGVRFTPRLDMPTRADGRTELVLDTVHQAIQLSAGAADLGTGTQGLVTITSSSLTPLGEQVKLTAAVPARRDDVRYISGTVSIPLGNDGLALEVDGYAYRSTPSEKVFTSFDRTIDNRRLGIGLSYPIVLNNAHMLKASVGAYVTHSEDQYHNPDNNIWLREEARLRVARLGLQYTGRSETQSRRISLDVYKGVDGLGARKNTLSDRGELAAPPYDLDFTRYALSLAQEVSLPAQFGAILTATGQYSSDILPSSEQISFGAWRHALGYPQGDQGGDKGYGVSLELNRRISLGYNYLSSLQPYVMVEHAKAWYNRPELKEFGGRNLSSVALGLKISDDKRYVLDLNVARPVGDRPQNSDRRKLRFNANYALFYDGF